jgi:universal stress protein A
MNPRKILITTDLSKYSLAALEYASEIGLYPGPRLYLLHVVDAHPSKVTPNGVDIESRSAYHAVQEQARKRLEEFVERNVSPDIRATLVVRVGTPVDEIRRFAEEEGVDLIVIATHGWTGLRHIVMGSVAERTVRHSSVPVLTVKPHALREYFLNNEDVENELHLR